MTRENAKLMLPIIQAWADGKTIQYHGPVDWFDVRPDADQCFDHPERYRIKPEPREWWIETMPNGYFIRWMNGPLPKSEPQNKIIHVREVLDD